MPAVGGYGTCSEGDLYGFTVCDLLPKASFGQIIIDFASLAQDDMKCLSAFGWRVVVLQNVISTKAEGRVEKSPS